MMVANIDQPSAPIGERPIAQCLYNANLPSGKAQDFDPCIVGSSPTLAASNPVAY